MEGARLFWSMMTRLQLESHPIVCWKFCYVIHRLLRDGHKHVRHSSLIIRSELSSSFQVVNDSVPLAPYFDQLGKFWVSHIDSFYYMTFDHQYPSSSPPSQDIKCLQEVIWFVEKIFSLLARIHRFLPVESFSFDYYTESHMYLECFTTKLWHDDLPLLPFDDLEINIS